MIFKFLDSKKCNPPKVSNPLWNPWTSHGPFETGLSHFSRLQLQKSECHATEQIIPTVTRMLCHHLLHDEESISRPAF